MSIDGFFHKRFDANRYNCANFAAEVWLHLTGQDIEDRLSCFLKPKKERTANMGLRHDFFKMEKPANPCLALFARPKRSPHVGVFYNGRVLHILKRGVEYMPVEVVKFGFESVKYYGVKNG